MKDEIRRLREDREAWRKRYIMAKRENDKLRAGLREVQRTVGQVTELVARAFHAVHMEGEDE